jgi:two-component system nitrate/nitrite response regulator NarL
MRIRREMEQAREDGSTIPSGLRTAARPKLRAVHTAGSFVEGMSVWLIDAHPLMRAGLKAQLDGKGFAIVAEGGSLSEVFGKGGSGLPHLIVVDMNLGLAVLGEVKSSQPEARVVVLAEHAELSHLVDAFGAGADGYLLKSISTDALVESLRLVVLGEKVFPGVVTNYLSMLGSSNGNHERVRIGEVPLSQRELDIIRHLADGHSNKTIANELSITEATVKVHLKTVLRKIGVANRTQVAIWAVQHGVVKGPNGNGNGNGARNAIRPR